MSYLPYPVEINWVGSLLPSQAQPRPLLRLGYIAQNPVLLYAQVIYDLFSRLLPNYKSTREGYKKILICNGAHLGDILSIRLLVEELTNIFPKAEIGLVCGSWSLDAVKNLPQICRIHIVDHWRLGRSGKLSKRLLRNLKTFAKALEEIKSVDYDVAIDAYPYFPNSSFLLWRAKIGERIGYSTGGGRNLFTSVHPIDEVRPLALQTLLLAQKTNCFKKYYSNAEIPTDKSLSGIPIPRRSESPRNSILIHPGSAASRKLWSADKWIELIERLIQAGYRITLTGQGSSELALCDHISKTCEVNNLANKLSWSGLAEEIARNRLFIGVDSVAAHVAAFIKIPSVVLFAGNGSFELWRPVSPFTTVLMRRVGCAQCHRSKGCATMACIREIEVQHVWNVCQSKFKKLEI